MHLEMRRKLYLSGDCSDEKRFNTLFRCFQNEYMSITASNSFAPYNTLLNYLLDLKLMLYPLFAKNFSKGVLLELLRPIHTVRFVVTTYSIQLISHCVNAKITPTLVN